MVKDPIVSLLHSRKFMVFMFDFVVSFMLYFIGKYGSESLLADIKFLIAAIQPGVLMLIYAIAKEDAAEKAKTTVVMPRRPQD